jgi:hypothetical protein
MRRSASLSEAGSATERVKTNGRFSQAVSQAHRGRRRHPAGSKGLRLAPLQLCRTGEGSLALPPERRIIQLPAAGKAAEGS